MNISIFKINTYQLSGPPSFLYSALKMNISIFKINTKMMNEASYEQNTNLVIDSMTMMYFPFGELYFWGIQ